jgi:hypothetical protein
MAWYVFALVDAVPARPAGKGFASAVVFRPAAKFFAAAERRADVPPTEFGSLQAHQQIVERIASSASSILPVRFGTLLTVDEIEESLAEREEEIDESFAFVRGRRQMTWRVRSSRTSSPGRARAASSTRQVRSGAAYLRAAAGAAMVPSSGVFRRIADTVGRLAVAERYQPRSSTLPDALYHLVDRTRLDAYATASKRLQSGAPIAALSGPWAPYAFVPELF